MSYEHPPQRDPGVSGTHEGLSDEECLNTRASQSRDLSGDENPAFGHDDPRRGDMGQQAECRVERRLEAAQIAIVDPDERRRELEGEVELAAIMRSEERRVGKECRL